MIGDLNTNLMVSLTGQPAAGSMISVVGGSTATTVENNVLQYLCTDQTPTVTVAADSAGTTTLDYNVVFGEGQQPVPYSWANACEARAMCPAVAVCGQVRLERP